MLGQRNTSSVSDMLQRFNWHSEDSRKGTRLVMVYKTASKNGGITKKKKTDVSHR